jgi:photosystem II stability/assembly factor-like uncharacterized protein
MRCLFLLLLVLLPHPVLAQWHPVETGARTEFRSASAPTDSVLWAGGRGGIVLRTVDAGTTWRVDSIPGARDLFLVGLWAADADTAVVLGTGFETSTARIYRTVDGGASWTETYRDDRPGIFLDGLAFWDDGHGVVFGDPMDGRFVVLRTTDGGASWQAVPDTVVPAALPGEAGFAASGRALVSAPGGYAWFGTGGADSARVFRTADRGASWTAHTVPIESGASAGLFALAFQDSLLGYGVGGDHTVRTAPSANVLRTEDGGTTWTSVGTSLPAGVRYGAALFPGQVQPVLVAVGPSGAGHSADGGATWTSLDHGHWNTVVVSPGGTGWILGPDGRVSRGAGF